MANEAINSKRIDRKRLNRIIGQFKQIFDVEPTMVVRAPGRVNLIGEHTDYNGYPVLPMAIERDMVIVLKPRQIGQIRIDNTLSQYGARTFFLDQPIQPYRQGDWGNYIKAGILGVLNLRSSWHGFDAMADGTIPAASGLSSSSALVVASALALLTCNSVDLDPIDLAQRLAESEKFVGTAGGGMDQTISLNGQLDHALKIDFDPLAIQPVKLPESMSIVICNSMTRAPKTERAMVEYNRRPMECQMATQILAKELSKRLARPIKATKLADLDPTKLNISQNDHSQMCEDILSPEIMSLNEIQTKMGLSKDKLVETWPILHSHAKIFNQTGFPLAARVRHVFSEALRVESAAEALRRNDSHRFGSLMNESHTSCRDDYGISTPEIDALVQIARDAGALGARLTGAGFGGCSVNLIESKNKQALVDYIWQNYYQGYLGENHPEIKIDHINSGDVIISSDAAMGADVFTL